MPWLINAVQLDKLRKSQKNITILDASFYPSQDICDAQKEFLASHVAGSRFFNIKEFCETKTSLPNMLTHDEKIISEKIGELGITNEHKIILYDKTDKHTSCRAFWMFKMFGHDLNQIYILDGGFDAWQKYGGKIETGEARPLNKKTYVVNFQSQFIRTMAQMKNNVNHPTEQVVDVRHPVRFAGGSEVRPDLRSGHIPGSRCFPFFTMFEANGRFKSIEKIRKQLTGIAVDLNDPIITLSGTGKSSAILNFVLDLMGHTQNSLYDGSWAEWGAKELYPGEISLDERPVVTSLEDLTKIVIPAKADPE